MRWLRDLGLRAKLLVMVLPLVILPVVTVGVVVGVTSAKQAFEGVTKASRDDLAHMATFATDLLAAHDQQFRVYRADKKMLVRDELSTLVRFAVNLVETQHDAFTSGALGQAAAKAQAIEALKKVSVGQSGYIYAMTSKGDLVAHVARQGENIYDEQDENGRYFIRQMCQLAVRAEPGRALFIQYPWKNTILGDDKPREKTVAYMYFEPWDWIVAAGTYLDETWEDAEFEKRAFEELKETIKSKKVGETGYIYALDNKGVAVIHPFAEGENLIDSVDDEGRRFIEEMITKKSGWIRYPWRNEGEPAPRMKIARYEHFEPWNWVVAVGSYETEFLHDAKRITGQMVSTVALLTASAALIATVLMFWASRVFTQPIGRMTEVIRRVRRGKLDERMEVESGDEVGELADAFNSMIQAVEENRELEATLASQGKMASLGVLSSGVAHEINNPLGVILGYAAYLERKLDPEDPNLKYIREIHRESKRSKKIVQDLLSYARTPRPEFAATDLNALIEQISQFAANHTSMENVKLVTRFDPALPQVLCDGDQLRQVAMNLILNAGSAMPDGGVLTVCTGVDAGGMVEVVFADTGSGIPEESLAKVFEPFYSTREKGTGLGLAITRQIIESHQGRISIESTVGEGTTVTVALPIEHQEF